MEPKEGFCGTSGMGSGTWLRKKQGRWIGCSQSWQGISGEGQLIACWWIAKAANGQGKMVADGSSRFTADDVRKVSGSLCGKVARYGAWSTMKMCRL